MPGCRDWYKRRPTAWVALHRPHRIPLYGGTGNCNASLQGRHDGRFDWRSSALSTTALCCSVPCACGGGGGGSGGGRSGSSPCSLVPFVTRA
jgi:hypothetical protein